MGGHATGDPVIPGHVPQRDQGKLARPFPSISLSSSPSLSSCWLSSLVLGAIWFGWHAGFTSIKLNQDRRNACWTQWHYLLAIYMKRRVWEMPQYPQPSMATSSLLYSALGSPRYLSGRSKIFSQGLSLAPQKAVLPLYWAMMLRRLRVSFPAVCRLFFTVPTVQSSTLHSFSLPPHSSVSVDPSSSTRWTGHNFRTKLGNNHAIALAENKCLWRHQ